MRDALPFLSRLVAALNTLVRDGIPLFPLQADAVIFCDNGDVLFLPAVMREIRDMTAFALTRDTYETLNHPDLDGESRASFSIAVMLYRLITGRYPFTGESPEEIHERARKLAVVPPGEFRPRPGPGDFRRGDGRARQAGLRIGQLSRNGAGISPRGRPSSFSAPCLPPRRRKRCWPPEAEARARREVYRRRVFWEKHWKTAAIAAAAVVILAALLGSILGNVLKPRVTRGYPPQKVVETFYDSMNSLDHEAMQACVIGTAGQEEMSQVTTLYVTSRVTQGYEGKSASYRRPNGTGTAGRSLQAPRASSG